MDRKDRALPLLLMLLVFSIFACASASQVQVDFSKYIRWGREDGAPASSALGRTFGAIRRMKFAMLPIMYKMGVMSTMLGFLTLFVIKGLLVGVALLVLHLGGFLAKIKSKISYEHEGRPPPHRDIHLHIHTSKHQNEHPVEHQTYHYAPYPYKGWEKNSHANWYEVTANDDPLSTIGHRYGRISV